MAINLAKNVKSLREIRGMTQRELAEKVYVTRGTIAKLENGWKIPSFATLMLIAEVLGTTCDALAYSSEENLLQISKKSERK